MRDRDSSNPPSLAWPAWVPALAAALSIVAVGSLTTWLVLRFDELRPVVGDMIVFASPVPDFDAWQLQVAPDREAGSGRSTRQCVFDPNVMSAAGGSLIVESREEAGPVRFRVHWAGERTAKGPDDCGASAEVTLNRIDLQRLANAAGGFGIRPELMDPGVRPRTASP